MKTFDYQGKEYYFLHIPKTGGRMWRSLFSDIIPKTKKKHECLKQKLNAYTFTIIRNPLDRLVSAFFYLKSGGSNQYDIKSCIKYNLLDMSFNEFIKDLYLNPEYYFQQAHFRPMIDRIGNISFIDHIALYDNLQQETRIMYKIFYNKELREDIPVIGKSQHNNFSIYYNKKRKNMIESIYEKDVYLYQSVKKRQQN